MPARIYVMGRYKDVLNFLYTQLPMYQRQGKPAFKKDLKNIIALCNLLDNPQETFKSIHIAGTNGKGTVSHILSSVLQEEGYKTGLYTSPHYRDFRERIKVNGEFLSKKEVVRFVELIEPALKEIQASFFEITVAMAFWHFANEQCDIAVIETGLGGRLDSTNVLQPLISVITNIGFDHQHMLGDTLEEIAAEKAGIIKENTPIVIGERQEQLVQLFQLKAEEKNAEIHFADDFLMLSLENEKKMIASYTCSWDKIPHFNSDIKGPFASSNLKTAVASMMILEKILAISVKEKSLKNGLEKVVGNSNYIGRYQWLGKKPDILVDSAHNKEGLTGLMKEVEGINQGELHIVLGFVNEKKLDNIIELFPVSANYYFSEAKIPRAMKKDYLHSFFARRGRHGKVFSSIPKALKAAKKKATKKDLILVTGSIFVVAEVI